MIREISKPRPSVLYCISFLLYQYHVNKSIYLNALFEIANYDESGMREVINVNAHS